MFFINKDSNPPEIRILTKKEKEGWQWQQRTAITLDSVPHNVKGYGYEFGIGRTSRNFPVNALHLQENALFMIKKLGSSGFTEVFVFSEPDNFAQINTFITALHQAQPVDNWEFILNPLSLNLLGIKKKGADQKTEVHKLLFGNDADNRYGVLEQHITALDETDEHWQFVPMTTDIEDLIAINLNGPYGVECHICYAEGNYTVVEEYPIRTGPDGALMPSTNRNETKFLSYWYEDRVPIQYKITITPIHQPKPKPKIPAEPHLILLGCTINPRLFHEDNFVEGLTQPAKLRYFFELQIPLRQYLGQ